MTQYTTKSTSFATAEIQQDFVIDETQTTRRIFKGIIVENPKDPTATVSGHIIHQRKGTKAEWENVSEIKLNQLKSGEGVKFHFSCSELKKFLEILHEAYLIGNKGVSSGIKNLVIAEENKIIEVPAERKLFIKALLEKNLGIEIWEELRSVNPDLATKFANAKIQTDREKILKEFELSLQENKEESYWQYFFENNQWIFGYGLKYQFLHLLKEQPFYGGTNLTGKGGQKGDYLMNTSAENKFTVLVEIKKPSTLLFAHKKDSVEVYKYRNGVPLINYELTGAISQIQVNCKTWEMEGSIVQQNHEELSRENIFTHQPKGILVVGHTKQLNNFEKRKAFELYRKSLHNPEILTFDELFERAKFIVGKIENNPEEATKTTPSEENDLPF